MPGTQLAITNPADTLAVDNFDAVASVLASKVVALWDSLTAVDAPDLSSVFNAATGKMSDSQKALSNKADIAAVLKAGGNQKDVIDLLKDKTAAFRMNDASADADTYLGLRIPNLAALLAGDPTGSSDGSGGYKSPIPASTQLLLVVAIMILFVAVVLSILAD